MAGASSLVLLAVFSGLSMNLVLQFGLGLRELVLTEHFGSAENANRKGFLAALGILFFSIVFLWLAFSFARSLLPMGFVEYILIFPASSLLFAAFEYLARRFALLKTLKETFIFGYGFFTGERTGGIITGGAFSSAALFIALNTAGSFAEAAVLSFGFTAGIAAAAAVVAEIRRRSEIETVPRFLRGGPLALVTMGLLSLVFSSAALMFFEILGAN